MASITHPRLSAATSAARPTDLLRPIAPQKAALVRHRGIPNIAGGERQETIALGLDHLEPAAERAHQGGGPAQLQEPKLC